MLSHFIFRGQRIPLLPSPMLQADKALFAGDSMTLLVGPNGSGKTMALSSLCSIFSSSPSTIYEAANIEWNDTNDEATTCAIYYTTAPFEDNLPKSNERYRKIIPSRRTPARDEAIGQELKSQFGLDMRRELTLTVGRSADLGQLLSLVCGYSNSITNGKKPFVSNPWMQDFRRRNDDYVKRRLGPNSNAAFTQSLFDERNSIQTDFAKSARRHLGPGFFIKFRAYLYSQRKHRKTNKARDQLLAHLGFSLTYTVSQVPGPASECFMRTLNTLQAVAKILGVTDLTNATYLVDDSKAAALDRLPLSPLGTVELVGLSSGAAALIDQFTNIEIESRTLARNESNQQLLLLIDEGDAFLHLQWQQRYVDYLDKTVARLKNRFTSVQVVLATHSPVIMSDFPRECITILDNREWIVDAFAERPSATPDISFGAPLDAVIRYVGGAGSIGSFSVRIMRDLVDDIAEGKPIEQARIDMIDDLVIRQQIQRMFAERLPASRT